MLSRGGAAARRVASQRSASGLDSASKYSHFASRRAGIGLEENDWPEYTLSLRRIIFDATDWASTGQPGQLRVIFNVAWGELDHDK
jgi:hypothetical protein